MALYSSTILKNVLNIVFQVFLYLEASESTVKPVLETTCIRRPPALRDQCSDTTSLLKSTYKNLHLKTTCCKRPLSLLPLSGLLTLYQRIKFYNSPKSKALWTTNKCD